jgi:AsmA family protein
MSSPETAARVQAALKWFGLVVGSVVVVLLVAAAVLEANADALRAPIGRMASVHLGRPVRIDGRLQLHLLSWTPRAIVRGLRIANPGWVEGVPPDMARIGQLEVSVSIPALFKGDLLLPYVGIDDSDLNVVRDARERTNWDFSKGRPAKPSAEPAKFPLLGSLHLGNGHLVVSDAVRKLHFKGTVSANQGPGGGRQALALSGDGDINGQPFKLTATGDPLITAETHKPYTVASEIQAGRTRVKSRITLAKPFDMGSVVADIDASGDDLADLYYLSGLALPNTAPYTVSSHLQREGSLLKLTDFKGTLGNSDIRGTLSVETATERPLLTADLATRLLDIKDLAPTLGSRAKKTPSSLTRQRAHASGESAEESTAKARAAAPKAAKTSVAGAAAGNAKPEAPGNTLNLPGAQPKSAQTRAAEAEEADTRAAKGDTLLPDAKLDLKRIRGMDANVRYHAEAVKTQKMSIREIALTLKLDRGVMTFTPVSFVLPQGKLTSNIKMDASKDVPDVDIDARVTQVELSQFKTKDGQAPLDGTLVVRAILHGRGKSLHEIGSTTQGTLSAVVPHGDIRSAFAELMGINAARGLGLLLTGNQDKTRIRCGVANFKAEGGVLAAQDIVIDTDKVLILGRGEVDLGPEILDLTLTGQPKKFRFFRIKSPIELKGTLEKPKVGLKPGNTPGEVALATALGVLATPLASVLAFIDPGLAKDADCSALIAEAVRQGAPPSKQSADIPPKSAPPLKDAQRSTKARSMT